MATVGKVCTATLRVTGAEGPLHPLAVTVMMTFPEKPFVQVITPEELIVPASAGVTDQLNPVLLLAMVAYVVVVVPLVI